MSPATPAPEAVIRWLTETRPERLARLWTSADRIRRAVVGDQVYLRGLIEISNHCVRDCLYCGLRCGHGELERYRLTESQVLEAAARAAELGCGTIVLQSGEDPGCEAADVARLIRRLRHELGVVVTLSLGERTGEELALWREAGASRYLLKFETSDAALYRKLHPALEGPPLRLERLRTLRELSYEIGSGVMVGLPGQTWEILARDLTLFRELDLDMIGVGPFLAHPKTPLGERPEPWAPPDRQVPADEETTLKVVALSRLLCPEANIPSTTALATLDRRQGRELGLQRGANVFMPNFTPSPYRERYEIYPGKSATTEGSALDRAAIEEGLAHIGRRLGEGRGDRRRRTSC
jgi:biotin synthase